MRVLLHTERLILRRFTEADADDLLDLHGDPEVMRFLTGGRPTPREKILSETLPRYLSYGGPFGAFGVWAAVENPTGGFIGWFLFRPPEDAGPGDVELGYRLRRSAWGKGYATEGSRALVHKGFAELGVRRVVAQTMAVNQASRRVMEKAGLAHTRTFYPDWPEPIAGAEEGEVEYALTREEWGRRDGTGNGRVRDRPGAERSGR
jgi:RimJ/RimL family protein N-acetyltransferase